MTCIKFFFKPFYFIINLKIKLICFIIISFHSLLIVPCSKSIKTHPFQPLLMPSQEKHFPEEPPKFYNPNDDEIADHLFSTNNVLIEKKFPKDSRNYPKQVNVYLPGYMRAKVKNINDVELTNLTSSINMDLIYDIYFGDLFESDDRFKKKSSKRSHNDEKMTYEQLVRQMFQNDFKLNFSRGEPVLLAQVVNEEQNLEIKVKSSKKSNQIGFTVRKVFSMHIDGQIWLSPFELLNSILQITVHPLTFNLQNTKYTIRINLMNHPDCDINLSFPENEIEFGKYQLAKNLTRVAYTNEKMEKPKEFDMSQDERKTLLKNRHAKKAGKTLEQYYASGQTEKDIKYFQYAYFNIPVFKHPFDTIITSIVPIWLLGTINLGIFFQDQNLNDRLGSIIGLVIALFTYIPTIEETTPPTPNLVMAKLMVYLNIAAVICTFIHSMRIKFEKNFRLKWKETPEYWIAFFLLVLSAAIVITLTIIHYAYWKRLYNDPMYSEGRRQNRKQWKREKAKKLFFQIEPINESQTSLVEPLKMIQVESIKGFKFQKQKWANLESDVYFNRFFVFEREKAKKNKNSNEEKKYADYFIVRKRQAPLTTDQIHRYYFQKPSSIQTQASHAEHSHINQQSKEQKNFNKQKQITNFPLVHFTYDSHSKSQKPQDLKQLNLYLPGYMRLKFKNFNSLDFNNLGGDLNATMIFTIFYGEVFEYLKKEISLNPEDEEKIMKKMKNEFVLMFEKDDALQLTQGKMEKEVQFNQNEQKIKPKRNIDLTIKEDPEKKCLQFTIRRLFQTHMDSYIFLTPIEKLKTSIDVNINSIKIHLKTRKLKTTLTISINLMDAQNKSDKISISQVKKFCRYGLILPELNIGYFNDKLEADKEFRMLWDKDSFWGQRELNKRKENKYKRIFDDIDKVFTKEEYTVMRKMYREMSEDDQRIKEYFQKRNWSLEQTEEEKKYLKIHKQQSQRKFGEKSSYQPYKYASIRIPLYKFPFDSIAIIFFPLWLLAILNLGIFFQTENFGERVISIAALFIAFVSLVPTIRDRIPPSPSITLVEFLVAALMFTCFLTLGHSMSVRFRNGYQFTEWGESGWFLSALVITLLTVTIVCILLIFHYVMLQPNYKAKLPKQSKFNRQMWFNQKCQEYTKQRYYFQLAYGDPQHTQNGVYKIFNYRGSRKNIESQKDFRSDNTIEPIEQKQAEEGLLDKVWRYLSGQDKGRDSGEQGSGKKRTWLSGTLRSFNDGGEL